MSGVLIAHREHAELAGLIRIDVGQVLGHLGAAVGHRTLDRYLVACAAVQFWADLLVVCRPGEAFRATTEEEIEGQLRRAECQAYHAAQALLGKAAAEPEVPNDFPSVQVVLRKDLLPEYLSKLLHLPMPECCGYDLADLELIDGDGGRLIRQVSVDRPVLIVGIRSGGTYLAPLWKAVLAGRGMVDVHWCTVRPQPGSDVLDGLKAILAWLERRFAPVVVVVDDQPDSGATIESVAALLCGPGIDLWFSSVGKLWRGPKAHPMPAHSPALKARDCRSPRLWECLRPDQHRGFVARLRDTPGLPIPPTDVTLQFRCPQGEARYGLGRAWLPWNDPRVLNGRRPLANPRKTPIVVCGPDGRALLHLRFIGEGVFGRAEFQRVRNMNGACQGWFVDGYAVTVDVGSTRSFRERFHAGSPSVRADLMAQAANWLGLAAQQVIAHATDSPVAMALGPRWLAVLATMRERCGYDPLPEVPEPMGVFLMQPVPWPGRTGRVIRSSLRYACGDWHWQVDIHGRLHRFQLEANWGDVSFPELELAAFILENQLALADARHLASLCDIDYLSIQDYLSLAALMIAEARLRSVRTLSGSGRITLLLDFRRLLGTIFELAGLDTPSGK
ncbi:hypothetical protein VSR34_35015 [Paraburkholderia sp. JHI2823]|uniref:hypothetical protein n=1 Tax=Paraburkholderia sp. JHI2823 TaxID=3112960 RepID=UPI00316EA362